jgi:hypothetical protein
VTELRVRHQRAVDEHRAADAGAERQHDHGAAPVAARAKPHLGEARGVGVVQHDDRPLQARAQQPADVAADPRRIDVGGGVGDAILHDRRHGHPHAARRIELQHDCGDGRRDRLRRRRLRGQELVALDEQPSRRHVHGRALDP